MDDSDEGLVLACKCPGAARLAHVSCLAGRARAALGEALFQDDGEPDPHVLKDMDTYGWVECPSCREWTQSVCCALGWACWSTYLGRENNDWIRSEALETLADGLVAVDRYADATPVIEAILKWYHGPMTMPQCRRERELSICYAQRGQIERAIHFEREVYPQHLAVIQNDWEEGDRFHSVAWTMYCQNDKYVEFIPVLREQLKLTRRKLGRNHDYSLYMAFETGLLLLRSGQKSETLTEILKEAKALILDVTEKWRRHLGAEHRQTKWADEALHDIRVALGETGIESESEGESEDEWETVTRALASFPASATEAESSKTG